MKDDVLSDNISSTYTFCMNRVCGEEHRSQNRSLWDADVSFRDSITAQVGDQYREDIDH